MIDRASTPAPSKGIMVLAACVLLASAASAGPVKHPNLLFDREELAALKRKIETQPWAKTLWEKELSPNRNSSELFVRAMQYALYGDAAVGQSVKKDLLLRSNWDFHQWYGGALDWTDAAAYDLTYDGTYYLRQAEDGQRRVGAELEFAYPELSEELKLINLELRAGKPRSEALRNLADRTGVDDLSALVTMLIQTDKFGTSVAQSLRVQSDTLRTKRRQRAEEAAAKTGAKMVFPLVFCIFPAIWVVTIGPAAIKFVQVLFPMVHK